MERGGLPERLVGRLGRRLRRHGLWDSLLMVSPPLLALFYLAFLLFYRNLIGVETLIFSLAGGLGVALALIFHYGRKAATEQYAARLIDERIGGEDRFVTLATINPLLCPLFFLARLRDEAKGFLHLIDLRRDFPYRGKRAVLFSLGGSLAPVLLFHLLSQSTFVSGPDKLSLKELEVLAQQLSQIPRLSKLARALDELAVQLPRQDRPTLEELSLIRELLREVEDRLAGEQQKGGGESDRLNQVANALRELEEGVEKRGEQGGGGLKTSQLEEREGKSKEWSQGEGVGGEGELAASGSRDLQGGRSAQGETEKMEKGKGEGQSGDADRLRGGGRKGREMGGSAEAEMEGGSAKIKEREIPRGKTPERFLQPGEEGEKGIEGARYVTVEIPEGQEPAFSSGKLKGRRRRLRPKVPVSNVPLPPSRGPDAAREKQLVPLEYRGLILK